MKVNLFIAGACKSGTTFLHDFLSQQKEILGAAPKEPYFFELSDNVRNENIYHSKYFKTYSNQKYLLDSRHRTMFFSWIPGSLHQYNPNAKLIFILRNPVERAFSHWWMWYSRGVIKTSFIQSINNEKKSIKENGSFMTISPEAYNLFIREKSYQNRIAYADANTVLESGYYYEQIKRFQKYFDSDKILILDFKQLSNKKELTTILSEFLDLKLVDIKNVNRKNEAKMYKKTRITLASHLPNFIKLMLKDFFLRKPKLTKKEYTILQDHYKSHNEKLMKEFELNFVKEWQR